MALSLVADTFEEEVTDGFWCFAHTIWTCWGVDALDTMLRPILPEQSWNSSKACAQERFLTNLSHLLDGVDLSMAYASLYLGDIFQQQTHFWWIFNFKSCHIVAMLLGRVSFAGHHLLLCFPLLLSWHVYWLFHLGGSWCDLGPNGFWGQWHFLCHLLKHVLLALLCEIQLPFAICLVFDEVFWLLHECGQEGNAMV